MNMGRKLGSVPILQGEGLAGISSNTIWPGPRPTCMPSFTLIHPTVWPQYTNVTDRTGQTDRDRQDNGPIAYGDGRTVLPTVAPKRLSLCYRTVVCLSVHLSVTLVYCGQRIRWIRMPLVIDLGPRYIVLDGDPAPSQRGTTFGLCLLWPNGWMDQDVTW